MPTTIDHRAPSRPVPDDARRCIESGCGTVLSTYNPRELCYLHSPVKFPRNAVKVGRPRGDGLHHGRLVFMTRLSRGDS